MGAVATLFGRLTARDYEDDVAADPRIDALRAKMVCVEEPQFTRDYHDPDKRSIANALRVEFDDGSSLPEIIVRSEEHTSELQSLMRISYAVFCLKKKKTKQCRDIVRYFT